MITDLKPYADYKESGLPWLGQVPGHWEVRRLKQVSASFWGGGTPQSGNSNYYCDPPNGHPWLMISDLTHQRRVRRTRKHLTEAGLASRNLKLLPAGTVLFSMYASLGTASILDVPAAVNQAIIGISPRRLILSSDFALYALEQQKSSLLALASSSTQANLNAEKVRSLPIPLPPPDEQAAIVRFLDWANGRLERAIRAKRKVIALLNEQKQAIIHRAVTRGLDPFVPLKDSGVPWLGEIPTHWEVERTKNLFRLRLEKSGSAHGQELLSIYTHIGVRPRKDLEQKGNKASTTDDYWIVHKGDLVVNKLLAWMGAIGVSNFDGVTSPAYDILMPIRQICSDYYHHLFRTKLYSRIFKQRSRGIMDMRLRLYFDQFGQIPIPVPPVDEQIAIVAFYESETADITGAISRLEREITLLREYRTRLVADVVTGKLDVREAAAALPDEEPLAEVTDLPDLDDEFIDNEDSNDSEMQE